MQLLLCVLLTSDSLADSIRWTGSVNGNWDTTTANWTGDDTTFQNGDNVTFADDPTTNQDITVVRPVVAPGSITVAGASIEYTLGTGTVSVSGTLELSGTKGSLAGSGSLILVKGGTLKFDDEYDHPKYYAGSSGEGRWGDGEPIHLNSGTIQLHCANWQRPQTTLSKEDVGTVNVDGGCTIHIVKGRGGGVFTAASVTRTNRGCLVTHQLDPLYSTVEKRARVCIGDGPSMIASNMFLPWIAARIGYPYNSASFTTYDSTLSPIGNGGATTSEVGIVNVTYTGGNDISAHDGANTDHILKHTNSKATLNNDTRVRALAINGENITISPGKTLTISSGGITMNAANRTILGSGGRVSFGDAEGIVWATGGGSHKADAYIIEADLLGSNGLTVCELTDMDLRLSGNNSSLSGPITLNYGTLMLKNANGLPNNQDLRIAGGTELNLYDQDTLTVNNLTGRGTIRDTTPTASLTVKGTANPGDNGCGILTLSDVDLHFDPGSAMVVDAPGKMGYPGVDFDRVVCSGQVSGITNVVLTVNPPENEKPRPMKGTEYLVIQSGNDLTGQKFKRISYPSPWKVYGRGTTNGMLITFSTIQGSVITVL